MTPIDASTYAQEHFIPGFTFSALVDAMRLKGFDRIVCEHAMKRHAESNGYQLINWAAMRPDYFEEVFNALKGSTHASL